MKQFDINDVTLYIIPKINRNYTMDIAMSNMRNKLSPREHAICAIVETIEKGVLPPGTQLPSENNLATHLKISRGTVRTALAELIKRGVLEKRGRRLYVCGSEAIPAESCLLPQSLLFLGTSMAEPEYLNRHTGSMDAVQGGAIAEAVKQGVPFFSLNVGRIPSADIGQIGRLRVSGALLFDLLPVSRLEKAAEILRLNGVPLLAFSAFTLLPGIAYVLSDHRTGMTMLTRELLLRGYRKILFYSPASVSCYWQLEQYAGYQQAMMEAGVAEYPRPERCYSMPLDIRTITPDRAAFENNVRQAAGYLLDYFAPGADSPEVIVAETDWTAQVIAAALRLLRKIPGKDVQITGYDNKCDHSPWNEFEDFRPLLTADRQNDQIGRMMTEELQRAVSAGVPPESKLLKPVLLDERGKKLS